ncbi:MAG: 16S rRNA (cytosine(1402)-N(4))-methyltransferase RsmH [bacterium]
MRHIPVMLDEVRRYLVHKDAKLILDGTVGCGGHARAILESNPDVELIGVDRDGDALRTAKTVLRDFGARVRLVQDDYINVSGILGGSAKLDGALLDLGLSSLQLDDASRGFIYQNDGRLDLRRSGKGRTAESFISESSEDELCRILGEYGEISRPRRVARAIKSESERGSMSSTFDLKHAVESVMGRRVPPAVLSRVFQAVRIAVNEEIDKVGRFLDAITGYMNRDARLVVVSYHSLEDRLVKNFFKEKSALCICPPGVPVCVCGRTPVLEVLTRRVVKPSSSEVARNPRSRSARLRAAKVINP